MTLHEIKAKELSLALPQHLEEKYTNLVASFVGCDGHPDRIVEQEGFLTLMKGLKPNFTVPSRDVVSIFKSIYELLILIFLTLMDTFQIKTRIENIFEHSREEFKKLAKAASNISLTMDGVTLSSTQKSYLVVTANFHRQNEIICIVLGAFCLYKVNQHILQSIVNRFADLFPFHFRAILPSTSKPDSSVCVSSSG